MTPFEKFCISKRGDLQLRIEIAKMALQVVSKHSRRADGHRAMIALCTELLDVVERHESEPKMEAA